MSIQSKLKTQFVDLVGDIKIQCLNNTILLSGNVFVSNKDEFVISLMNLIENKYPGTLLSNALKINEFTIVEETVDTNKEICPVLDEINILYYGYLDTNHITQNDKYKIIHENNRDKLDNIVKSLNFISPIILNSNLEVIDGNFRLQLAEANDIKQVLVVIIDDNSTRADFLRLALNRTSEFQRWNYRDVDNFVDNTPQAQPLLEPIGFFGRNVLPTSFFSNTVVEYIIDPFNEKQKQYSQEEGLAEWAKYRREQMAKLSAKKRAKKPKKTNAVSLFDLKPKEDDFLKTYDIDQEMEEFVNKYKDIAGEITDREDAKKKAEIEEKGGVWQRSHRTSKEVAEDNRNQAIQAIQETDILTNEEKLFIVEDIDSYFDRIDNIEEIANELRNENI